MSSIVIDPKYALTSSDDDTNDANDVNDVNGPKGAHQKCLNCAASFPQLLKCSRCKLVYFCNASCQRASWDAHKTQCTRDPNSKERPAAPEPPRLPTKEEQERSKDTVRNRIEKVTLPRARKACDAYFSEVSLYGWSHAKVEEDFDDVIDALEDAIVFAIGEEDEALGRETRVALSRAYLCAGRLDESAHYLTPELERAKKVGGVESAVVHVLAARTRCLKGEKERCRRELTAALDCASESTSDTIQGDILLDVGLILHDIGDWEKCAPILSTAAEAMEKLGRIAEAARAYNRAGSALFRLGRPDQAARCWVRELTTLESDEASTVSTLAQAHGNVASAFLLSKGAADTAFNVHKEAAFSKAREAGVEDEARLLLQLGNAYKLAGESVDDSLALAKQCFEKAKSISKVNIVVDTASRALEMLKL